VLPEISREAARRFGDAPAFVRPDGSALSYAELDRHADEVAAGLRGEGVREGDVVALVGGSTTEYVVAYLAAARLGAITTGVNPRLTAAERDAVLAVADPVVVLDDDAIADLRVPGAPPPPTLPPDPERLVAIVFTSGTTGVPRGAVFGNRELAAIARIDAGDRWGTPGHHPGMLASTQFAHVGFMTKLPWYLRTGTTTYLLERWRPPEVLRLIAEHRITSIGGIAPQLALLLRDPDLERFDLSCVETIVMGGAASPPALVREARARLGAAYSIRYSSTESGGVGTATAFDADDEEALHTVGRPRPGVEVEIRDEQGRPVGTGEVGEVALRSPCVMRGYWRDPEATAQVLRDGWLHTGDLGRMDERGCLRLVGRTKEMFVRGGYNVYPLEVEAVLADHPAVRAVAVVPRPDEVLGEIGVAVVVPANADLPPTLEELRSFASTRLAGYKLPEAIRVVDELPLTSMQKIDRRALAAREAHEPSPA